MVQYYGRWKEAALASGGLILESDETTTQPSQLSRHEAQEHKEGYIAGVFVVLGMFLTPGAAVAGLHESTWLGCFPLRSSGMFAHACCVTTRVTAGVGGGRLALWLGFQKSVGFRRKLAFVRRFEFE